MNILILALSHLLVLVIPLFLLVSASPNPYPAVVSLPDRPIPPLRLALTTPARPEVEHDVLPFVLISTIDGALHAVDRNGGNVRWTLKEGVEPLVGGRIRGYGNEEEYIVEPLSGGLYVFEDEGQPGRQQRKVRKLPLSVEQL